MPDRLSTALSRRLSLFETAESPSCDVVQLHTNSYRDSRKSPVWWPHQRFPRRGSCHRIMRLKRHCVLSITTKIFFARRIRVSDCTLGSQARARKLTPSESKPFEI